MRGRFRRTLGSWRDALVDRWMDRADHELRSGDAGRALRLTRRLVLLGPRSADVRCLHARALGSAGRAEAALENHLLARSLCDRDGRGWVKAENAFHAASLAARLRVVDARLNEALVMAWLGEALEGDPGLWRLVQESALLRPFGARLPGVRCRPDDGPEWWTLR